LAAIGFSNKFVTFSDDVRSHSCDRRHLTVVTQDYVKFAASAIVTFTGNGTTTFMDAGAQNTEPAAYNTLWKTGRLIARPFFCTALNPAELKPSKKAMVDKMAEIVKFRKPYTKPFGLKPGPVFSHFKVRTKTGLISKF
jgi:hypothetical protein